MILSNKKQKDIISKGKSYRLKAKQKAAKNIAEARFLRQKWGKSVGKIKGSAQTLVRQLKAMCGVLEQVADSWRRTGLLTFDGNRLEKGYVCWN